MVYELTKGWPTHEQFGLTSQIRRAAVSNPSNLAEGCGRSSPKELHHFISIARGSAFEIETQAEIAYDLGYVTLDQLNTFLQLNQLSCRLLTGMMNRFKGE